MTNPLQMLKDLWALGKGMGVTGKNLFRPVVTCQYPRQTLAITARFRGHTHLLADPENPGRHLCFVCGLCEKACPSGSILEVAGEKKEGEKKKTATRYLLDFTTCSQCGLCVEACPVGAIGFSGDYNPAGFSRQDFHYDLVREFHRRNLAP
jgi:NADH-quinone oxidoreductase subunit I